MKKLVLQLEGVSLAYGDVQALDHVSLELGAGETAVILGAAGSGKTVLLKTSVGLLKPDSGRVYLFDEEIKALKESALADLRSRVGILFQEGALFDSLTVEENVSYPLENQQSLLKQLKMARKERGAAVAEVVDDGEIGARVREALRFVELEETLDKFPSELSGGMRRRVGIARAVVTRPELLLYDSPTAGLDPITANTIVRLILKERDLRNAATMLVTHRYQDGHLMANFRYNPSSGEIEGGARGEASQLTTKFVVMREGCLVFEGSQAELRAQTDSYIRKFSIHDSR